MSLLNIEGLVSQSSVLTIWVLEFVYQRLESI